jgi:peptidoglycan pentaglycine glycine transferase (the first glycine)
MALDAIESHARRRHCIFLKIDPDVRSDLAEGVVLTSKLKRRGWRLSREQVQFKNTAFSDLVNGDDVLLAGMKSKWRYNIRLAQRRGITVRQGTSDDLRAFYAMYAETGARDGFLIRPYSYYASTWQTMLAAQQDPANPAGGALLLAEHEEEAVPVAGLFLMKYQDRAWYFYGASTDRRRRDMPNHLLQWEAMRWALLHGCRVYDWWGAPTDLDDPLDAMQSVWKFKQGFGAVFQPHIGAWDLVINSPLYALYSEIMPRALSFMRQWNRGVVRSNE